MALIRWEPFGSADFGFNRMPSLFGRWRSPLENDLEAAREWLPSTDISETDKEYLIKAELPEVKKEDVKVNVEDGVLTISGERKFEKEEKDKKYHRIERSYGSFMRSFSLPDGADSTRINAEFKDGVLRVHLPKNEKAKTKSIEVKVQ